MKVDSSLGSLLQGVSQQAPRDRLNGQCTLQENMTADAVNGLSRRPPTDLVGYLGSASQVLGWHNFQTRDGNKFLAMFKAGGPSVFDLNAEQKTVTTDADALAYLANTTNMRCSTDDEDKTFVVNPSVKVQMSPSPQPYFNTEGQSAAIFQVLGGAYGKTFEIYIDGVLRSSYKTPVGANANDPIYITTDRIAENLVFGLYNAGTFHPDSEADTTIIGTGYCIGWEFARQGDIFWVKKPSGTFTSTVNDGAGGVNFKVCTDAVTDTADLPRFAPHYYAVRIAENTDANRDMWFKFVAATLEYSNTPSSAGFGKPGYWKEAVAPATDQYFDRATMPHTLAYSGGAFTFKRTDYDPRGVGTTTSNPDPSFVGNVINDVTAFQGRTVFLSGSNVIMSRTNRPPHFWRGSVSALVDTDPIDINSTVESSQMLAAVQFNKDLAVFTPKSQHVVFGRTAITPMNAALVMTTRFECEAGAHPVPAGRNVFFASNFGRYTGIREFFSESTSELNDSRPITQHVNRYLRGKAHRLTASANYETLLVHTDANQTDLYLYQYIWQDDKKVQSAWSTWKFEHDIVYSFFDEDLVYLVQKIGNDYYLLRLPLDVQESSDVGYPVYLDQRFDVPNCNTQFVLPYDYLSTADLVVVQSTNCNTPGLTVAIESIVNVPGTGYVVTLKKDMQGGDLIVGTRFMSRYMPTMPMVKDQNGVVIGTANLRARSFVVSLDDTGQITGIVRSKYGDGPPVTFNARIVGDVDNVVGEQPLSNEHFVLPFRHDATKAEIELYTNSHLPMNIADIEYVGQYNKRGRRIANASGDR